MASKVWDDLSFWNVDFSLVCPEFTLKRINELEAAMLEALDFVIKVSHRYKCMCGLGTSFISLLGPCGGVCKVLLPCTLDCSQIRIPKYGS